MSELRNKLIRLAHNNPELREHLIPVLKTAGKWSDWEKKGFAFLTKGVLDELSKGDVDVYVPLVAMAIQDDWHWSKFEMSLRKSKLTRQAQQIIISELHKVASTYQRTASQKTANQMSLPVKLGNSHIRYRFEDGGKRLMVVMSYRVWNSTVVASALIKDLEVFEKKVVGRAKDLGRLLGIRKVGHQTLSPDFVRVELGSSATKHPLLSRHTSYYEIYEGQVELARMIMEKGMGASEIK